MPWVILNFLGTNGLTPVDLIGSSLGIQNGSVGNAPSQSAEDPDAIFLNLVSTNGVAILYSSSLTMFIVSIALMSASAALRKQRRILVLIAGVLSIISSIAWFTTIEVLKVNFSEQASMTGGLIGEEFKGNERYLIDTILRVGFGPVVLIPAGASGIMYYFVHGYMISGSRRTNNQLSEV
jgi:hypothetical protein